MRWSSVAARGLQHSTTVMITNTHSKVRKANKKSTGLAKAAAVEAKEIFFGIDAADAWQVVTRFIPGEGTKPAERMTKDTLVKRVAQLRKAGVSVHCVYEAGPTGFALARELIALGAKCLVVRARQLERYGRRRKNDKRDSRQLALDLANHCAGRTGLLIPVRIPTPEEELRRLPARERETFCEARYQLLRSAQGRALALGYRLPRQWWRPRVLPKLLPELPPALAQLLERTAHIAQAMKQQLDVVENQIKAEAPPAPVGVGALTAGVLDREVMDWRRIKSSKKAGSFTGLSPSEHSTGKRWQLGPVDKHGNPRLRFWCQEAAWRLLRMQPNYRGVIWAREKMRDANKGRMKQIAVALARRFFVDWWRIRTGQVTPEQLGFIFKTAG
jgi:transposase